MSRKTQSLTPQDPSLTHTHTPFPIKNYILLETTNILRLLVSTLLFSFIVLLPMHTSLNYVIQFLFIHGINSLCSLCLTCLTNFGKIYSCWNTQLYFLRIYLFFCGKQGFRLLRRPVALPCTQVPEQRPGRALWPFLCTASLRPICEDECTCST